MPSDTTWIFVAVILSATAVITIVWWIMTRRQYYFWRDFTYDLTERISLRNDKSGELRPMLSKLSDVLESIRSFQARFEEMDSERSRRSNYELRETLDSLFSRISYDIEHMSHRLTDEIKQNLELSESALTQIAAISSKTDQTTEQSVLSVYQRVSSEYSHLMKSPISAIGVAITDVNSLIPEIVSGKQSADKSENANLLVASLENMTVSLECIREIISCGAGFLPTEPTVFEIESIIRKSIRITSEATGSVTKVRTLIKVEGEIKYYRLNLFITLMQILENAFEIVPKDGNIKVIARPTADGLIEIIVENDGPQISPDIMDKIFNEDCSTKGTGRGLGLAVAKKSIESVGGKVSLMRSQPAGTAFKITFDPLKIG